MINFYQWRSACWTCCLVTLVRYAYTYQSRAKLNHDQLSRITAELIQTEATFDRVSRELKRARSRSRSRSRSVRTRRREEKITSPRRKHAPLALHCLYFSPVVIDLPQKQCPSRSNDDDNHNKENVSQVSSTPTVSNTLLLDIVSSTR